MCKRNSSHKYETSTGCVRKTPQIKKKKKEKSMGSVSESPHRKIKQAWDVKEKLPTEK